jgi:hypothetical protein
MTRLIIDQNDTITNLDVSQVPSDPDTICIELTKEWKEDVEGKLNDFNKYQMFMPKDKFYGMAIFLNQIAESLKNK